MIDGKRVLGIIPARGGSKGIPRKNLRELGGKPMIWWTIRAGLDSHYVDRLILSSDDAEICAVASAAGCDVPFVRPAELARDETPGIDPVIHALDSLDEAYDLVALLQPTSPLRNAADVDGCIARCVTAEAPACVSVSEARESPYWMFTLAADGRLDPLLAGEVPARRQDLPPLFILNGAVYVARTEWLAQTKTFLTEDTLGYVMPPERSVDVDTPLDLLVAAAMMDGAS